MEKKTERPFITSRYEGAHWPALKRLYSRKFLYMSNDDDDDDKDGWAREALSQTRVFGAQKRKGRRAHVCACYTTPKKGRLSWRALWSHVFYPFTKLYQASAEVGNLASPVTGCGKVIVNAHR